MFICEAGRVAGRETEASDGPGDEAVETSRGALALTGRTDRSMNQPFPMMAIVGDRAVKRCMLADLYAAWCWEDKLVDW